MSVKRRLERVPQPAKRYIARGVLALFVIPGVLCGAAVGAWGVLCEMAEAWREAREW